MSQATYDDVNLILRLYELRRETKMREARAWFFTNFKCKTMAEFAKVAPPGSEGNAFARQMWSYWDMASSFVTSGVLNEELLFQSNRELLLVWVRVEPILAEMRAAFKDPSLLGCLEKVAASYIEFLNKIDPGAYAGFKARVGG